MLDLRSLIWGLDESCTIVHSTTSQPANASLNVLYQGAKTPNCDGLEGRPNRHISSRSSKTVGDREKMFRVTCQATRELTLADSPEKIMQKALTSHLLSENDCLEGDARFRGN